MDGRAGLIRVAAGVLAFILLLAPLGVRAAALSTTIVLQVYPLLALGDVDPAAGADLSVRIADEITGLGGIHVLAGNATTPPAAYRSVARDAGAGYYLTGSIAVVGKGVAAIVQIVSTRSGTVLWSNTAQLVNIADIAGEGARVRDMLLDRDQRPYLDLASAAAPAGSPKTAPPAAAKAAKPVVAARPLPLPPPDPVAPQDADAAGSLPNAVVLLGFTGQAPPSARTYAERSVLTELAQHGLSAGKDTNPGNAPLAIWADRICTETAAHLLLGGTLGIDNLHQVDGTPQQLMTAHVELIPYDCDQRAFEPPVVRSNASLVWTAAVARAVSAAVGALAKTPPHRGT